MKYRMFFLVKVSNNEGEIKDEYNFNHLSDEAWDDLKITYDRKVITANQSWIAVEGEFDD